MDNQKPQLHSSHLGLLYKCGEKFCRMVLKGEKEPATIPLVIGQATHTTVARNLNNVISKGSLLPREAVQDYARDDFIQEWQSIPIVLNADERFQGIDKTRDLAQDVTIRLVTAHHYTIAPGIKPQQVERKWVLEAKDYPYDMAGQIDIDEGLGIRDTKTRKSNLGQREVDTSEQYTIYAMAKYVLDKILPEYVVQDNLVKPTARRDAYAISYYSKRTMDDFQVVMRRFDQANKVIKAGVFTPANPQDWWCSPNWCGFAADGSCPFYNNKFRGTFETMEQKTKKEANHGRARDGGKVIAALESILGAGSEGNDAGNGARATGGNRSDLCGSAGQGGSGECLHHGHQVPAESGAGAD